MAEPEPTSERADFDALVGLGQQAVLRYLLARTRSSAEAAELLQETFVRAYCALAEGRRVERPLPWLLAIARNVYLEAARGHRYERQLRERMAALMGGDWQSPWRQDVEHRLVVGSAVDALPTDLREPVLLHYFGGLSIAEVAGHLEITAGAVKTRLWRARHALRGQLEVLVTDTKRAMFEIPPDLAAKAKVIAERPPVYDSVAASIHVGGPRWATAPLFEPQFPDGKLSWEEVRFAVERLRAALVAGDRPLANRLELPPLLELFYHPKPVEVWRYLRSAEIGYQEFQNTEEGKLAITDGWQLGTDPDAPKVLAEFREAGLRHLWFTFAGLRETHDDLCQRPGAFDAIVKAMERCRDAGIETGANIIVTTRNVKEIGDLQLLVWSLGGERFTSVLPFVSGSRARDYLQPTPSDLSAISPKDLNASWSYRDSWGDPEAFTEAALVQRAVESEAQQKSAEASPPASRVLRVWVWPDLGLRINDSGLFPCIEVAHLRRDPPDMVYRKLVEMEWPPEPPSDAELATRYGDATSRKVFYGSWEYRNGMGMVRLKWLEAWRKDQAIPWLPWPW